MWKRVSLAAGVLAACAACPTRLDQANAQTHHDSRPNLTCDEQVLQVQPVPTGEDRAVYVSRCLLQHEFAAFVRERRTCSRAGDCIEVQTSCPFGDGVSVARPYAKEVELKHGELFDEYTKRHSCKYRTAPHGAPSCADGQCAFLPWSAVPSGGTP